MKKIITIFAFTVISFTANADGNTNEVNQFINTHTGVNVLKTSESTTHPQPSRRDAAGAVLLNSVDNKDKTVIHVKEISPNILLEGNNNE